jgi:hypothetical protein
VYSRATVSVRPLLPVGMMDLLAQHQDGTQLSNMSCLSFVNAQKRSDSGARCDVDRDSCTCTPMPMCIRPLRAYLIIAVIDICRGHIHIDGEWSGCGVCEPVRGWSAPTDCIPGTSNNVRLPYLARDGVMSMM